MTGLSGLTLGQALQRLAISHHPYRRRKLHRLHPLSRQQLSPKAKPTPKKAKAERKTRPGTSPVSAGRATEEATNAPAPGGGHGQVWVNTETGIYHSGRLAFLRHDEDGEIHDRVGRNPGGIQTRAEETIGRRRLSERRLMPRLSLRGRPW
jgi:hypothetical protein